MNDLIKVNLITIAIFFLFVLIFFLPTVKIAESIEMTANVKDNSTKYLIDLMEEREEWVDDYAGEFLEDSKCWVHWLSCGSIKHCVRDAVFCIPN